MHQDNDTANTVLGTFCPRYHHAVELIGRRWSGAIIRALFTGCVHFSDFRATIPGLSDRMLSERLKELEAEGIISRLVIPSMPVTIEYHLTDKGRALATAIEAIARWAEDWIDPDCREQPTNH